MTLGPPPFLSKSLFLLRRALNIKSPAQLLWQKAQLSTCSNTHTQTNPQLAFTKGTTDFRHAEPIQLRSHLCPAWEASSKHKANTSLCAAVLCKGHQALFLYDTHNKRKTLRQNAKTQGTEAKASGWPPQPCQQTQPAELLPEEGHTQPPP